MLPRVVVLTTGGTIAGAPTQNLSYQAGSLPGQHLLESVPQVHKLASVSVQTHANVGSQDVDPAFWSVLATEVARLLRSESVDAVVITHGTDTLEETAFFLHLAVKATKPVILTGAMYPPHVPGADGPANLIAAITAAASPMAKSLGVCVAMDQTLYDAVEVQKQRAGGVGAFCSRNQGPLGRINQGGLHVYAGRENGNPALRGLFTGHQTENWPVVPILYAYGGMESALVQAVVGAAPDGIVLAGVGNGNASQQVWKQLGEAVKKGTTVIRSTRTARGHVLPNLEVDDDTHGFVAAGGLNPQKARVLLLFALQARSSPTQLQSLFLCV
ncbi:MAG TPA: asparaginase [Pusillimonas sp.]|uniref:asparaginase n=1 Tax=Pusillimonas sp. TaxID=3040095 RepID=UPI002C4A7036|nr:asparaginase [Pusillimonas sp.]HUH86621.1 asparaginase [Pusillimonas sp.]